MTWIPAIILVSVVLLELFRVGFEIMIFITGLYAFFGCFILMFQGLMEILIWQDCSERKLREADEQQDHLLYSGGPA
jgi:protein-S-isoprenylcysteine O-methyltransferase Ste14